MARTNAERQKAFKKRRAEKGLRPCEFFLTAGEKIKVTGFILKLRGRKK